ncbi:MAG: hypothetical protein CL608_06590 [Anaerolineaceae bacterium]|nr:hypothetical protein [Anaerolineaceae bacterium]
MDESKKGVSRRDFLRAGSIGMAGLAGITELRALTKPAAANALPPYQESEGAVIHDHGGAGVVGQVDHEANGFHPHEILTDFDYGEVKEENGRIVREWNFVAIDKEFEIGYFCYPAKKVYSTGNYCGGENPIINDKDLAKKRVLR